jgi:hypothetical protein
MTSQRDQSNCRLVRGLAFGLLLSVPIWFAVGVAVGMMAR